jgi:hypothetical protein
MSGNGEVRDNELDLTPADQLPKKRSRGNPNFIKGNQLGKSYPALVAGEKSIFVGVSLPASLKAKLDALPGKQADKLRRAVYLLVKTEGVAE